jgi:hypothetical protein
MDKQGIELYSLGGETSITSLVIHELESVWN